MEFPLLITLVGCLLSVVLFSSFVDGKVGYVDGTVGDDEGTVGHITRTYQVPVFPVATQDLGLLCL